MFVLAQLMFGVTKMTENKQNTSETGFEDIIEVASEFAPYGRLALKVLRQRGVLERFVSWIKQEKTTKILLTGASGTGKSSLLSFLIGSNPQISRNNRTTVVKPYSGALKNLPVEIIDTPGDPELKDLRKEVYIQNAGYDGNLGVIKILWKKKVRITK